MSTIQGLAPHVHHEKLVEWCYDLEDLSTVRRRYIREKPAWEQPTRLRLLKMVAGSLSPALTAMLVKGDALLAEGIAMWVKGDAMWVKGQAMLAKGSAMRVKGITMRVKGDALMAEGDALWGAAIAAHMPELERLHALECRACPWDGTAIFPRGGTR